MALKDKLLKNSTIAETALLKASKVWLPKDLIVTDVPALNIALSGRLDGGMGPGILQIAGASKRFKSKFAIVLGDAFQKSFPDGAILYYDSEFGTPESYWEEMNVDSVVHTPVTNLEELTIDIVNQLENVSVKDNDKLLIILDSLGNIPSKKEVEDAKSGKGVVDMTRAKAIKALFRMIGPTLAVKNVYMVVINHTYKTLEMYAKEVASGGTGIEYNSNGIWIIGAEQIKEDKKLEGFNFKIRIEKSRFVKQGKVMPITVTFDAGIEKWSGILDLAVESGIITRPTLQKYAFAAIPENQFKKDEIEAKADEFYKHLIDNTTFADWVKKEFIL